MTSNRQRADSPDRFVLDRGDITAWSKRQSKPQSAAVVKAYVVSLTSRKFYQAIRDLSQTSAAPLNAVDLSSWCNKEGISIVKGRSVQWSKALAFYERYLEYANASVKQRKGVQSVPHVGEGSGCGTVKRTRVGRASVQHTGAPCRFTVDRDDIIAWSQRRFKPRSAGEND